MRIRLVVVAVLLALAGGFLGAAAGSRLGWELAPSLPTGARSDELKSLVFPGLRVWGGGDAELFVEPADGDGIQYGQADYWIKHTPATRDIRAYTAGVRDRLAAAGWRIRSDLVVDDAPDAVTESHTVSFWAERDGLVLSFSDFYWPGRPSYDADGAAMFQLYRAEPARVTAVTWLGAALGAGLILLLGWWVRRRVRDLPARRGVVGPLAVLALVCLVPAALIRGGTAPDGQLIEPWWVGLVYLGEVPAVVSAILAGVILAVAAWPRRPLPGWARAHSRPIMLTALAVVAAVGTTAWVSQARPAWAGMATCRPTGVPAEPPARDTRYSRSTYVYVSQESTPEQRNYIEAAIFRVMGAGAGNFSYDPRSPEFSAAYCGDATLDPEAGRELPYFFAVDLSSPGAFPALVAEVQAMPGVVGVRHALVDE
jgi:hypothetical protein